MQWKETVLLRSLSVFYPFIKKMESFFNSLNNQLYD